jgi:hypothetical protein
MIRVPANVRTGALATRLFDCHDNCEICIFAFLCPCMAAPSNWAAARGDDCGPCHFFQAISPVWTRGNIRRARGAPSQYCCDLMMDCCCGPCMIVQDAVELDLIADAISADIVGPPAAPAFFD